MKNYCEMSCCHWINWKKTIHTYTLTIENGANKWHGKCWAVYSCKYAKCTLNNWNMVLYSRCICHQTSKGFIAHWCMSQWSPRMKFQFIFIQNLLRFLKFNSALLSSIESFTSYGIHHFKLKQILFIARSQHSAVCFLNSPNFYMKHKLHGCLLGRSKRMIFCTFDVCYELKVFPFFIHVLECCT